MQIHQSLFTGKESNETARKPNGSCSNLSQSKMREPHKPPASQVDGSGS